MKDNKLPYGVCDCGLCFEIDKNLYVLFQGKRICLKCKKECKVQGIFTKFNVKQMKGGVEN